MIVKYTNDCIQSVLERFAPVPENGKSSYFRLVNHIDIKAFFGILYLYSAFQICVTHVTYGFMKVHMTCLPLPCHGIHFILSASSFRLMISQHATINGKMTNMHAWENCLKKWMCKIQNTGFPRHYLPLMKPCIHTVVQSTSKSTTPTSQWSMDYRTKAYAIRQPCTPNSHCHMLGNPRLLEKHQSFISPELTSTLSI